ncbi:peptidylprolyl isomerase [Cellulophaga sp. Hel_I_12]|uniref:peptidylprolyl isomerase n=1 Tax=Cellulophaga sp. Hel_I_12 TaxID=1249972 RepID=UPI0006484AEF|nr:peptidylprolyl isomerase [Cellulophaga sp. Hel_I_12]
MKLRLFTSVVLVFFSVLFACSPKKENKKNPVEKPAPTIEILTNYGAIELKLYNETPLHRDNFLKLIAEKAYDSVLFHRVIKNFMIQAGDPNSKNFNPKDTLGSGDVDYTIPAEFHPKLFHKKGVLAAARESRPDRASSGMQFYIVQGKVFNDSLLRIAEGRINQWLAENTIANSPTSSYLLDSLQIARTEGNPEKILNYTDSILSFHKKSETYALYRIPEAQREVYKTIGGTPHLDQNYTVFGETTKGLEVLDSIASTATNDLDRPLKDIRILSVRVLNEFP